MNQDVNKLAGPLQKKCVVFLDILGFKELVKSAAKDVNSAENIQTALEKIRRVGTAKQGLIPSANVTIFSDSVVISTDKDISIVSQLIRRLAKMMWTLMCDGIWMRGGISMGLLADNSQSPWGPAFIDAYETETRLAVHPRLVLSRTAYEWISDQTDVSQLPIKRDINDGIYFLDVIGSGITRLQDMPEARQEFENIAKHINSGHISSIDNPGVYQKYSWLCREWDRALGHRQVHHTMDLEPFYTDARQQSAGDFDIAALPKI